MDQRSRRLGLLYSTYSAVLAFQFRVCRCRYVLTRLFADAIVVHIVKAVSKSVAGTTRMTLHGAKQYITLSTNLAGFAWTYVHLIHGVVTYYLLHWHKGSPINMDQGRYDKLTFWEQLDDGVQNTINRKFFTLVPVVLFLLATHGSDYRRQPLGLNLAVVLILVIAKFSSMHKVRLFGIGEVKY